MQRSVTAREVTVMICGTEPRDRRNVACFFEQPNLFDNADALIEISVAALTTEPELRDIGRSLISLARYYVCKKDHHFSASLKSNCD
jgi:hypothetical protein